jgi:hypothetical protein
VVKKIMTSQRCPPGTYDSLISLGKGTSQSSSWTHFIRGRLVGQSPGRNFEDGTEWEGPQKNTPCLGVRKARRGSPLGLQKEPQPADTLTWLR